MKQAVVYIPGLNDNKFGDAQMKMLSLWKIYNIETLYVPMNWSDKRPFSEKLENILKAIDGLVGSGFSVSLFGTSAGASAALNAYSLRHDKISKVICVCGKINHPETILDATYQVNPAFKESMAALPKSLSSLSGDSISRILSLRPLADNLVPPKDTIVAGAQNGIMPTVGHGLSISYSLTLGSTRLARFVRS